MQFPLLCMLPSKLTDPLLPSQKLSLFISLLNSLENLPTTINGKSYNDVCLENHTMTYVYLSDLPYEPLITS